MTSDPRTVESAQVVLPATEPISATIDFFTSLGFKVRTIVPADHPRMAVLAGHGLTLRLESGSALPPGRLRLLTTGDAPGEMTGPNGTVVEFAAAHPPLHVPELQEAFVVSRAPRPGDDADHEAGGRLPRGNAGLDVIVHGRSSRCRAPPLRAGAIAHGRGRANRLASPRERDPVYSKCGRARAPRLASDRVSRS